MFMTRRCGSTAFLPEIGRAEDIIDRTPGEFEPHKSEDCHENAMIELMRSEQDLQKSSSLRGLAFPN
jgi:hypothetical protein